MAFPYWGRRPPPPPRPEPLPPAVPAGMADEFADKPFGGGAGEFFASDPATTTTVAGLTIEPPDWSEALCARPEASDQAPAMTAYEQMMANAAALGEIEEPHPIGPPVHYKPLQPVDLIELPKPNWRQENP